MFKNHLKFTLRIFLSNRVYSALNILGLSLGMAGFLFILQYVHYEWSFDRFHTNVKQIYRVDMQISREGKLAEQTALSYAGLAPRLAEDFPEVQLSTRLLSTEGIIRVGEKEFREEQLFYTESAFFQIFSFPLLDGESTFALEKPNTVVISERAAKKYFGEESCIGKTLRLSNFLDQRSYTIVGLMQDIPANSHLQSDFFFSYPSLFQSANRAEFKQGWRWADFYTYVLLKPEGKAQELESRIRQANYTAIKNEGASSRNIEYQFNLRALEDIHLYAHLNHEMQVNGEADTVFFLLLIAGFILLMAWVNYINLSTAKSLERAREVGVRKVVGAGRGNLIQQFLIESFCLNILALILAAMILEVFQPFLESYLEKEIPFRFWHSPLFSLIVFGVFLVGILLSSLYPAWVLSAYRPIQGLKNKVSFSWATLGLRKALIIFQFSLSSLLILGTIAIYEQVSFMRQQDLGMNLQETLVLQAPSERDSLTYARFAIFKRELLQHPDILGLSASHLVPGDESLWTSGVLRQAKAPEAQEQTITGFLNAIEYDFIPNFEMEILSGRNFSKELDNRFESAILSQKACQDLGFESYEKAISQKISIANRTYEIVGVLNDYHQLGLQSAVKPYVFIQNPEEYRRFSIKVATQNLSETLNLVQDQYEQYFPEGVFEYFFLDEHFDQQYQADQQFGKISRIFSLMALFLAALGLFGLSMFMNLQRRKEVGIRKILGASTANLLFLLSWDFLKLILFSNLLAAVIAFQGIRLFLDNYVNKVAISPLWFLIALSAIMGIALISIAYQTLRITRINPVQVFREH